MTPTERDALIGKALEYAGGSHTVQDVVDAAKRGEFEIWEGRESIVVTQVVQNPRCKEAVAFLAAGDLEEIARMYPTLEEWARSIGCTRVSCHGRRGWERTFLTREAGWRAGLTIFEKELT